MKLLFDENILTRQETYRCELAIIGTSKILLEILEGKGDIDLEKLSLYIKEILKQINPLVSRHFSKKSMTKVEEIFGYLQNMEFLETLLFDKAVEEQRSEMTSALRETLDPFIRQNRDALLATLKESKDSTGPCKHVDSSHRKPQSFGQESSVSSRTHTEYAANHETSVHSSIGNAEEDSDILT